VTVRDTVRRRARDRLRGRGIEVLRIDWDVSVHALHTVRILDRYQIATVLDVGAREGEYGLWLRDQGYRGRIVSFEPVPANLEVLRVHAATDPAWEVRPYALGAASETRTIQVTAWTHFSSFRAARNDVVRTVLDKRAVAAEVEVQVRRLDEVWDGGGPVLLKCDTQGWDLEVLRGAGERLAQVAALQSEVSSQPLYDGMPDMLESLAVVRSAGFMVSGLFPLNGGPDFIPVEFDLMAVRPPS
jgi:FkbM family methyltransferase